jgi:hypothetical protein
VLAENDFNKQLVVDYLKKLSSCIKVAGQKTEYIQQNPVNKKWQLAKDYFSDHYSSARFYETGMDDVGFLKNIFTVMYGD